MAEHEFSRIKRLPPYVFAEVNAMKARARAAGEDIIDFGMGNPDSATPPHIVEKLVETVRDPRTHRYSNSRGIPGLRKAVAGYYQRRFDVDIDPETEAIVTLGSKEGLANLAQAMATPGDVFMAPDPSYPIHAFGFIIAGATVRSVPIGPGIDFMEGLELAVKNCSPHPVGLIINFPANPTAEVVDLDFYACVVDFCRHHDLYVISDNAYAEIYFDQPPPSILQVPGAKEVAIEFYSLSKTYSMPGWRIGFGLGNRDLIAALARIKSYVDYGAFTPLQVAAAAALNGPQECVEETRALYRERRDVLMEGLSMAGWKVPLPKATMFVWAPIPSEFAHLGSVEFSKLLLSEAQVAVSPGLGFGEYGDNHVRFALVENLQRTRQALRSIKALMRNSGKLAQENDAQAVS
jgi:alanine-synthesizing transaminase